MGDLWQSSSSTLCHFFTKCAPESILSAPTSILARFIVGKYFENERFITADWRLCSGGTLFVWARGPCFRSSKPVKSTFLNLCALGMNGGWSNSCPEAADTETRQRMLERPTTASVAGCRRLHQSTRQMRGNSSSLSVAEFSVVLQSPVASEERSFG